MSPRLSMPEIRVLLAGGTESSGPLRDKVWREEAEAVASLRVPYIDHKAINGAIVDFGLSDPVGTRLARELSDAGHKLDEEGHLLP